MKPLSETIALLKALTLVLPSETCRELNRSLDSLNYIQSQFNGWNDLQISDTIYAERVEPILERY